MRLSVPRLVVAGLSGDAGKTLVSLGIVRALARRGAKVAAFKKGPDYIDAAWLGAAAGKPGRNLDTFLMKDESLGKALETGAGADLLVVEGNRGLYDGVDAQGGHSTAELAKKLGAPILLVVDVTKTTRTAAALVLGCQKLDPEAWIAGVVLNRVATPRHEAVIRDAIASATGVPVLGAIGLLRSEARLVGRHLGLVTAAEHPGREEALEKIADVVECAVALDAVVALAGRAFERTFPEAAPPSKGDAVRIGVVRDVAFSFYYPENLEALEARGAELVPVAALEDEAIPDVDAVYVGGGFPEVHAERLSLARRFLGSLREAAASGVPVYAECGGLMLLSRDLSVQGRRYPMAGVLDLQVEQTVRPKGHGYAVGSVDWPNPFFAVGTELRGHEFHYSHVVAGADAGRTVMGLSKGTGVHERRDGVVKGNVWASYVHLHASTSDAWADGLVAAARRQAVGESLHETTELHERRR
jgi:cobyrinic acid a,c-diamide synthase